jgi:2-oxoglutarate/2-oxoacid ferredoxin oxidoreductase subunit beta
LPNQREHDPSDMSRARDIADDPAAMPVGLLYRNENAERYDHKTIHGLGMSPEKRLRAVQAEVDRFLI